MSGLMTYLCLTQAGVTHVSIIEAGQRLGGGIARNTCREDTLRLQLSGDGSNAVSNDHQPGK